ncbi:SAM-dependent methyltransferase [Amycolatopsis sp.]|uniref:SAM-dependent methyltransferase n=1 Tax=Amycolatopsis sp. TaxID=37632 RepID=UPI0039C8B194
MAASRPAASDSSSGASHSQRAASSPACGPAQAAADGAHASGHPGAHRLRRAGHGDFGSLLQFIPDECEPAKLVAEYRESIPPGSYLALCTITAEQQDERLCRGVDVLNTSSFPMHPRGRKELLVI